jgi:hypothetical protein
MKRKACETRVPGRRNHGVVTCRPIIFFGTGVDIAGITPSAIASASVGRRTTAGRTAASARPVAPRNQLGRRARRFVRPE